MNEDMIVLLIAIAIVLYFFFLHNKVETYDDPLIIQLRYDMLRIEPRAAMFTFNASNESFTEDKKHIFICMKDDKGQYYPYNMLVYVALHELAHGISAIHDADHTTREFRDNFDMLLRKATSLGVWNPQTPLVANYCGINNKQPKSE